MMMERESDAFHFYGRSSGYANTAWVHDEVPPMLLKVGSVEAGNAHYDVLGFENPPKWEDVVMQWCDDQRYHGTCNAIQVFHLIGEGMHRVAPTIMNGFNDGRDLLTKAVDKRKFRPHSHFLGDVDILGITQLCTPGSFVSTTVVGTVGVLIGKHFSSEGICCLDSVFMSKWFIPAYQECKDVATIWSECGIGASTQSRTRQAAARRNRSSTSTGENLEALGQGSRILIQCIPENHI